jgi:hypothetical protein
MIRLGRVGRATLKGSAAILICGALVAVVVGELGLAVQLGGIGLATAGAVLADGMNR